MDLGFRSLSEGDIGSGASKMEGLVDSNASTNGDGDDGGDMANNSSSIRRSFNSLHSFWDSCIRAFKPVSG